MSTSRSKVTLFLVLAKQCAEARFVLTERKKNLDTLAQLGMGVEEAKRLILGLSPDNYVSGPSPDHANPGQDVWTFGLRVGVEEIYVKLSAFAEPNPVCLCLSFHIAEQPLKYPFREPDRRHGVR